MGTVKILSIQSAVAYGHVGNSAAVFPLQRIGVEVLPVMTVNFSNHTGYGAWRGSLISPEEVHDVILGIQERGILSQVDVVLSGYQGGHRHRRGHRGCSGPRESGEPLGDLRVRPGHG